ncbi:MAG: hypothetical protein RL621_2081 [Bacteroidota bacterium]|jgi:hypothetical protein
MRILILCLLYSWGANSLFAQQMEGKWKGYFSPNNSPIGKIYSYEMDITQGPQGQLTISTFTKLSSEFSANAYATGSLDKTTQLVHIEEQGFLDLSIQENYTPCLMNNFLIYKNIRGHEIIEGTYTSYNKKTGKDCGGGKIYLEKDIPLQKLIASEKVAKQKITKEKGVEKNNALPAKIVIETKTVNTVLAPAKTSIQKQSVVANTNIANPSKPSNNKTVIVKNNTVASTKTSPENINTAIQNAQMNSIKDEPEMEESILNEPEDIETEIRIRQGNGFQTVPWALVARENKLAKKITTSSKKFSIDLYDNGTIDNDTIIVYDNKKLIVSKKRLSYKAIHLEFTLSEVINEHEIIIVAHNMGTVPPNTALLVLKDGDRRQELFITSTNKMNAKIIVNYTPPPKE